ncbi:cytochrome P450 [Mycena olivaceomarginata]|nr:cytochrome P450 [Mycena olivaceomarginata]
MTAYFYSASCVVLVLLVCRYALRTQSNLPLPPGPRKLPLLGNLLDMPSSLARERYMQWSKTYNSDILHLNVAGTSIIILSSGEVATDLLEKRVIYSDRPALPMVNDLMGWDFMTRARWRLHRRLFHKALNFHTAKKFRPTEISASHELLRRILHHPLDIMEHFKHMAAKVIMSVAYGIDILPSDDPYVSLSTEAMDTLVAAVPGRFLVDMLPILKYVPDWFPGAGFKAKAKEWRTIAQAMSDAPFAQVKRNIPRHFNVLQPAAGTAQPSFASSALNQLDGTGNIDPRETDIKDVAGTMYTAGAETVTSLLGTFVLAMLANPGAQKKAQAEIDSVIGRCLPSFTDEGSMPYVAALVKETLRWGSVAPIELSVPHFLPVEDEYRGYRIPAGSIVIVNLWAILHDEKVYPDPYSFKPERFLQEGKPEAAVPNPDAGFGFGRRICPGRYLANSSLWIAIVSILATFEISKAVGDEPTYEYSDGLVLMPRPFKYSIKPRSQRAVDLIEATAHN